MVRRLLSLFKKPSLQVRELYDMAPIVEDFQNHGFAIVMLRPEHTATKPNETPLGPYWPHHEHFAPGGYL